MNHEDMLDGTPNERVELALDTLRNGKGEDLRRGYYIGTFSIIALNN